MKCYSFFTFSLISSAMLQTTAIAHPHHISTPSSKIAGQATAPGVAYSVHPSYSLPRIVKGDMSGDTIFVVNTPPLKELPPNAVAPLGPNWASDSADGFRLVAGAVGDKTYWPSPWEPDGSKHEGQQVFSSNAIDTTWTFNAKDGNCQLPDGAVVNAVYATWATRGRSGASYSYREGDRSGSFRANHSLMPNPNLEVSWTDAEDVVRTTRFQRIFKGPIVIKGQDGFTLSAQKMEGKNSHQTGAIMLDVTLYPTSKPLSEQAASKEPKYQADMEPLDAEVSSTQKMVRVPFGDDTLDLLWVEPGSFVMGSPKEEPGYHPFENQHQVTLTKGFYLGKYEVTQGQYTAVKEGLSYIPQGQDKPAGKITWGDAIDFCRKLTERERKAGRLPEGMSFQLPTEAEWEYACRAGTTTTYWWGNNPDPKMANFGGDFMGPSTVKPVGQYPANPWGFYDMHGNHYEWCNDIGGANDRGDPDDVDGYGNPGAGPYHDGHVFNPRGNKAGGCRIQRGGCYWSGPTQIRSAYRHSHPGGDKIGYKGFRVALKVNVPDPEKVIAKKIEKKEPNYPKPTMKLPTSGKHAVNLNRKVKMDMIWCPPGTFTMGSPSTETGHYRDEVQHKVTLTKGFFLGKYEVTQAQYLAVMTGNTDYKYVKPSRWPYHPNRPVENISWKTVQVFLKRLNHLQRLAGQLPEGWAYVLPTEAQWEYACRAGTTTAYSWGDSIDKTNANYLWKGEDDYNFFKDDKQPCEIGRYAPNSWGFYDMHGNVGEWTADWLGRYPGSNPVINPTGATSGHHRVTRGGSWRFVGIGLRSAARHGTIPQADDSKIGFRVALLEQTHPEDEKAADEAPAREVPAKEAHEAPAGEVPVAPSDMEPLDAPAGEVPVPAVQQR